MLVKLFKGLLTVILHGLDFVCTYIDDLLLAGRSMEERINHLKIIFKRLKKKYRIVIYPIICTFGKTEIEFLGHRICVASISLSPTKTEAIIQFPVPHKYEKFAIIFGYGEFLSPLYPTKVYSNNLTNLLTNIKKYNIVVSGDALSAFNKIKAVLTKTNE